MRDFKCANEDLGRERCDAPCIPQCSATPAPSGGEADVVCRRTPFSGGGGSICTTCGALEEQQCIGKELVPEADIDDADETASLATLGVPEGGWLTSSGLTAYAVAVLAHTYAQLRNENAALRLAHPVVTEAMVEAGCVARFGAENWSLLGDNEESWRELQRVNMRVSLTAALAAPVAALTPTEN